MFKNKKANSVMPYTISFFLFNLFVFILISAFAIDGENVGNKGSFSDISSDTNLTEGDFSYSDSSFVSKYTNTVFNLPWWFNTIIVSINAFMILIIILGWIRGV